MYHPNYNKIKHYLDEAEREIKYELTGSYIISAFDIILMIPVNIGRKLAERKYIYQCSGCPDWHVGYNFPEGVTREGFIQLMKLLFSWEKRDSSSSKA
jgi:hypothetical protein